MSEQSGGGGASEPLMAGPKGARRPVAVLILGTADWNQAIATNQHYITRELCRAGFCQPTFVESLALRRPQLRRRDLERIAKRLISVFRQGDRPDRNWRSRPEGLNVITPMVIPVHVGIPARINKRVLYHQMKSWLSYDGPRLLWTYSPVTYGLFERADATVYHCVDLLGTFPGIDSRMIARGEKELAAAGAYAAATSEVVKHHLEDINFQAVQLWENVADIETIRAAGPKESSRAAKRVIFAGNLTPAKVDFEILEMLSNAGLEVLVAGPRAEGGGSDEAAFKGLLAHGVKYIGLLSLEALAHELVQATVGLIPYRLNDYTRGVSPLKTYEYLAAGLTVVSTDLPGVTPDGSHIWVETSRRAFVDRVLRLAQAPSAIEIEERLVAAESHSWVGRGHQARELANAAMAGKPTSRSADPGSP